MKISLAARTAIQTRSPFHDRIEQVVVARDGTTARFEVTHAESLSCALLQAEIAFELAPNGSVNLDQFATAVCDRMGSLDSTLKVIEHDFAGERSLLRSEPIHRQGIIQYFEVVLTQASDISIRRFSYNQTTNRRASIAFVLTYDQLEKWLDELLSLNPSSYAEHDRRSA